MISKYWVALPIAASFAAGGVQAANKSASRPPVEGTAAVEPPTARLTVPSAVDADEPSLCSGGSDRETIAVELVKDGDAFDVFI